MSAALVTSSRGPVLYRIYAGGAFSEVSGIPRDRIVEFNGYTGLPTALEDRARLSRPP